MVGVNGTAYDFLVTEQDASWIGSSLNLGAAAMCIPIGILINLIGRKNSMLMLVVPFTIGWALIIWAQNLAMLVTGRVLLGVAGGSFCVTAPLFIGEIAQKEIRGTLGSYFQLMITIGILFVYAVGAGVNVYWLSIICGTLPLIFGAVFVFMPESPAYLVMKDKQIEATKSYKWLRGNNYDPAEDIAELQNDFEEQKSNNLSTTEALKRPATVRAIVIAFGMMFFQQVSGINAVIFYTSDIFGAANTGIEPQLATIIIGVMQVVATFVSSLVVDRLGRRILLLVSDAIMALCTLMLGIFFYMKSNDENSVQNLGWLPIVSLCVFIVAFSIGFGPVPWLMVGELFASDIKGLAGSLTGTLNWFLGITINYSNKSSCFIIFFSFTAFVITKTFTDLNSLLGAGQTFWLFSGLSILGTVFVFFVVPETKGKSLNDIQKMLAGEKVNDSQTEEKN